MVGQLFVCVFLVHVQLLQLLGIHLSIEIDPWWQVGGLQSLHVELVLERAQLVLIKLMVVLRRPFRVRELLGINLVEEVTELGRHRPFLRVDSNRVGTQAGAVVSVAAVHHVGVDLLVADGLVACDRGEAALQEG